MSEAKHMPGPWEAVRGKHGWRIGPQPGGACTIHDDTSHHGHPQQEANARLIAASPDLLYIVQRLVASGVPYSVATVAGWDNMIRDAEVALAKATGKCCGTCRWFRSRPRPATNALDQNPETQRGTCSWQSPVPLPFWLDFYTHPNQRRRSMPIEAKPFRGCRGGVKGGCPTWETRVETDELTEAVVTQQREPKP